MIVYQTDANGIYVGDVIADESPLEPGVYLLPAGCVSPAPPLVAEKQVAVWRGDDWLVVADHRGETWWAEDRTPTIIDHLGDPAARGLLEVAPPPPPPTSADLRSYAAARRWALQTGGVTVAGIAVDTSDASRAMIADAVAYVQAASATSVEFKASSGWVTLPAETLVEIGLAVGAHVQGCFAAERAVDAAISAGSVTTTAEIDAWSWPRSTLG